MIKVWCATAKQWCLWYWQRHRANALSVLLHGVLLLIIIIGVPIFSASNSATKTDQPVEIISASLVAVPHSQASPPPAVKPEPPKPIPTPPKSEPVPTPPKPVEKPPTPAPPVEKTPPPPPIPPKVAELPKPKVVPKPEQPKTPPKKPTPEQPKKPTTETPKKPTPKPAKTVEKKPVSKAPAKPTQTAQQKQQAAKALQQMALSSLQSTADQLQEAQAEAARLQSLQEKYLALIQQTIRANWINPFPNSTLQVVLTISLDTAGNVLSVTVLKSSGNDIFDRQVIFAVRKSSPLPMPTDPELVKQFTTLNFTFSGSDDS